MKTARRLVPTLALLVCAIPAVASHIPVMPETPTEFQGRIALLLNTKWLDPMLEVQGRLEGADDAFRYRSVTLGTYVRPLPNIKLGVFYRLQAGVRHDDDWVATDDPAVPWVWQDTTGRLEHELIADLSPRFLLPFLPGKDWVFMLKTRYMLSSYGGLQHSVLVRPTLTWFLMQDREPLLSLALGYGLYFHLDPEESVLYEHTPYLDLLVHLSPSTMLEVSGAFRTVLWRPSASLIESGEPIPDSTFPLRYHANVIGLGVVVSLAP